MSGISSLWQTRYRTDAPKDLPDNPVLETLLKHHSVRAYLPDALPSGTLEAGIAAASSAATSSNLQVWSVVAVENPETRAKLAELSGNQKHIEVAPLFLAWIVDLARLERIAERAGKGSEALDYEEIFLMSTLDVGIAAQNAVTAFESMGLGTVYIGGLRNHPEDVAKLLNLPPKTVAVVGMCVGRPDPAYQNGYKPRLGQDVVVHRERYDVTQEPEGIAAYDHVADAYQQEQGLPSRAWSETVAARVDSYRGLSGRHVMKDVLNRMGFALK
ncbi:nitroreductase [Gluconobacter thailandicus F149-1 = NBRC 100600]|uniref:Oxidoreductase n=1 Tax=Gluconobacter thailandicus NBRC 3257 TaxID=1381097 RepID=A0ABQ0IV69_GLUTH|nr:NADPH-dependent oxidoreductase [Gluconobacter thailandicus]KXV52077.1 nitroreductase [Gluconobacter thailandicus]GAC86549.1 oxidoreductase [Gluconobacter thailandicus NBRC 3255]GAD26110.1 oxidoreductase [Gluconobacter thailandicus NBRC 3257]GAN93092.1 nitroreductase [Gluconobacter thailandicus F149-1 = NBRC 100600]GBR59886.1 nitroreductase [Gluconobacter thailandicus F149-1 = NBRC 100600]